MWSSVSEGMPAARCCGRRSGYAARSIRNRLIDHYRREKRRGNTISLYTPDTEDRELADTLADEKDQRR